MEEHQFQHWIDLPLPNQVVTSMFTFCGWIAAEQGSVISEPTLYETLTSQSQPLAIIARPDVAATHSNRSLIGFQGNISTLDFPENSSFLLKFYINETACSIPVSFAIAPEAYKVREQKKQKLNRIKQHLGCPSCGHEELRDENDLLVCESCSNQFQFNKNSYNFLNEEIRKYGKVKPTDNISSNGYDDIAIKIIEEYTDGLILDNGCGYRYSYYDNVVNFEIADYPSTDVLGIGEKLPFKSNTFDAVFSFAVLEHVQNPFECAQEIIRVLKPGGKLYVVVPFLQPFHGYPDHYYNMTSSGLKNLFGKDVKVLESFVPPSGLPIWCLTWFLNSYLSGLPVDAAKQMKEMKIADFLGHPLEYLDKDFVTQLSPFANLELACTNVLIGVKREHKAVQLQSVSRIDGDRFQNFQPESEDDHTQSLIAELEAERETWKLTQAQIQEQRETIQRLRKRVKNLKNRVEDSEKEIAAMKTSKFWKIRSQWLKLKQSVGLASAD